MKIDKAELAKLQQKLDAAFDKALARKRRALTREAAFEREYGPRLRWCARRVWWAGWQN